jgi:hypothetical protein
VSAESQPLAHDNAANCRARECGRAIAGTAIAGAAASFESVKCRNHSKRKSRQFLRNNRGAIFRLSGDYRWEHFSKIATTGSPGLGAVPAKIRNSVGFGRFLSGNDVLDDKSERVRLSIRSE